VILFTAVLPAEYGIDPFHTGAALGLTDIAQSAAGPATGPAAATPSAGGETFEAPVIKNTYVKEPGGYKVDSRELRLEDGEGIEIKYHMQKGAGMVYSWAASPKSALVFYELHGEPDVKPANAPEDYYESYDLDDKVGKNDSHGTFIAPTTGIQGWFWENGTGEPVTIKLVTAGFYDYILQNKDDIKTKLQPSDPR
jgi:hypothetical protein